jgi:hypothetical protein
VILSIKPDGVELLLSRADKAGISAGRIGTVGGRRFVLELEQGRWSEGCRLDVPIEQVSDCWSHAIEKQLNPG